MSTNDSHNQHQFPLPCKQCILYPSCISKFRSIAKERIEIFNNLYVFDVGLIIVNTCELLKKESDKIQKNNVTELKYFYIAIIHTFNLTNIAYTDVHP